MTINIFIAQPMNRHIEEIQYERDRIVYYLKRIGELKTLKCSRKRKTECIDCGVYNMDFCLLDKLKPLKMPPQSWCYVENERWE